MSSPGPSPASARGGRPGSSHPPTPQTQQQKSQRYIPHEERLKALWLTMVNDMSEFLRKEEKAHSKPSTSTTATTTSPQPVLSVAERERAHNEAREHIKRFYRYKTEYLRALNHVEAKLQGRAQEMISMETYVRTEPCLGHDIADQLAAILATPTVTDNNGTKQEIQQQQQQQQQQQPQQQPQPQQQQYQQHNFQSLGKRSRTEALTESTSTSHATEQQPPAAATVAPAAGESTAAVSASQGIATNVAGGGNNQQQQSEIDLDNVPFDL